MACNVSLQMVVALGDVACSKLHATFKLRREGQSVFSQAKRNILKPVVYR